MKITNDEAARAAGVAPVAAVHSRTQAAAAAAKSAAPGAGPAAHIELSAQAQALSAAKTEAASYLPAVNAAPDIRSSLVDKLKAQVASGTYHVSSAEIAEQIVRRTQADTIH